jgi:transposase
MPIGNRYAQEIRERAVRVVVEYRDEYRTEWVALASVLGKLRMTPETLRTWVRRDQVDGGRRLFYPFIILVGFASASN